MPDFNEQVATDSAQGAAQYSNGMFLEVFNSASGSYAVAGGKMFELEGKRFSYSCGCGASHAIDDAFAVKEFRNNDLLVVACPTDDFSLTMLKLSKNWTRTDVVGVEPIASFKGEVDDEVYEKIHPFKRMKANAQASLKEHFEAQQRGVF